MNNTFFQSAIVKMEYFLAYINVWFHSCLLAFMVFYLPEFSRFQKSVEQLRLISTPDAAKSCGKGWRIFLGVNY